MLGTVVSSHGREGMKGQDDTQPTTDTHNTHSV